MQTLMFYLVYQQLSNLKILILIILTYFMFSIQKKISDADKTISRMKMKNEEQKQQQQKYVNQMQQNEKLLLRLQFQYFSFVLFALFFSLFYRRYGVDFNELWVFYSNKSLLLPFSTTFMACQMILIFFCFSFSSKDWC